ncbi:MAG: GNAT family N-acetyltransferase, partial [Candidatus Tectomicrobia bacterium]|nr:GNAT family N-acetyltransferase [Candidatus Tectomicrobia bacterium]
TLQTLPAFFNRQGYLTDIRVLYEAPTHIFGDPVADQKLVKKNDMRLRYNYYRRNGELEFKNCTTVEDIMVYLELFFRQHTRRRTLTDIPSQFLDERQRIFYTEMVQRLAPSGYLLFSVLLFNQTPIAFHIGFEYDNRLLYYQPTFNVDYVKKSPGIVLLKFLLEYALERNVAEFDFSIGEEPYKYRFANDARVNHEVRVFRRPLPYHLDRVLLDAKGLIKRSPTLSRLGRRFLRQTSKE